MAQVQLENLGSMGVIRDIPAHELPPEAISNGQNIRFREGKLEKFMGHSNVYGTPLQAPYWLLPWQVPQLNYWLYASPTDLFRVAGTTHSIITRSSGVYNGTNEVIWTGGILGGVPIVNNDSGSDYPQQWDEALGLMRDLDNWPVNTYCKILKPFGDFMVAADITESANRYSYLLRWSHPAEAGTVPTSWDVTDDTVKAGERPLSQTSGAIKDMLTLGKLNVIYKEDAVYGMQFSGGQSVFNTWEMWGNKGILSTNCAKEFFRKHFVVGLGDVYVHNGQEPVSIIDLQNKTWLYNNISSTYVNRTHVVPNYRKNEMWICFPSQSSTGQCDMALIWNWKEMTWSVRELDNVAYTSFGIISETEQEGSRIIDNISELIEDMDWLIDGRNYNPADTKLLMANPIDTLLQLADSTQQFNGTDMIVYAERESLPLAGQDRQGNPKLDPHTKKFYRRFYPKMKSTGPVTIRIGGQDNLNDSVTWKSFTFDPRTQTYIDPNLNTTYLSWRVESSSNISWELTGFGIDMDIIGQATQ